jgi:phenylpropionate dioxygenase-like ring-hydroxylating dioxygenase large terminal subunit
VHYNTIGRGKRSVVDGPLVEWQDEDKFFIYVFNRVDDGRPPRKASELSSAGQRFRLEFIFPNLWQNYISPDVRVVAAFVPVDGENCILYLRFYQKFLSVPLLSQLVNRLAMPFNVYIAHQDRRVVETQQPKRSMLRMDEKLIQADNPIIAYRRRREALIAAAERGEIKST